MTEINSATLKGLFYTLVKAYGGSDAASIPLGISRQRVEQIYSLKPEFAGSVPSFQQVLELEVLLGQAIVTGALAKIVVGDEPTADLLAEAQEVTEAAAELQRAVRKGAGRKEVERAVLNVQREAADLKLPERTS